MSSLVETIYETVEHYEVHTAMAAVLGNFLLELVPNGVLVFFERFGTFGLGQPFVLAVHAQPAGIAFVIGLGTHKGIDTSIYPWRCRIVLHHDGATLCRFDQGRIHITMFKIGIVIESVSYTHLRAHETVLDI